MKKLVIILFLLQLLPAKKANSQEQIISGRYNDDAETTVIKLEKREKEFLLKDSKDDLVLKSQTDYRNYIQSKVIQQTASDNNSFNIVSSFRKNIRFGGFWQGYAIINFTPQMYLQPFNFLSVYASHNYSRFIPISSIKDNFRLLAIEGAAIIAVENSIKYIFPFNKLIQSVISFTAKSLLLYIIKNDNKSILEFQNYYYSVSIKF